MLLPFEKHPPRNATPVLNIVSTGGKSFQFTRFVHAVFSRSAGILAFQIIYNMARCNNSGGAGAIIKHIQ
jgi:hypothetical protein